MKNRQVHVWQQPDKLKMAMVAEGLSHGQTVRADVPNIATLGRENMGMYAFSRIFYAVVGRVLPNFGHRHQAYFCNMYPLKNVQTLTPGDQGAIPDTMVMDRHLENAIHKLRLAPCTSVEIARANITSNGHIVLSADELTKLVVSDDSGNILREELVLK